MPSLMLNPVGCDKSTISLHWSEYFLRITPYLLMWASGIAVFLNGPTVWDLANSSAKYLSTTSGCRVAELRFLRADLRKDDGLLKLSLKPWDIPAVKKWTKALLGWLHRALCHCIWTNGVMMAVASDGTWMLVGTPVKWAVQLLIHVVLWWSVWAWVERPCRSVLEVAAK